jgi:protein pelota
VSTAGTHSVTISPGNGLTLIKTQWTSTHTQILNSARATGPRFLLVAIDRREAGVGVLAGAHLSVVASVDSGASGKGGGGQEASAEPFFRKVVDVLRNSWREGDEIVIAGPGHTKLALANRVASDPELGKKHVVVEGFDLAGTDGVRALLKFEGFRKVALESVLVEVQQVVEEVIRRMARGDTRVSYSFPRVKAAAISGAVEACVVSDDVFGREVDEEDLVSVLNEIEEKGGSIYLADSSLEMGKQVSSFGGIVAILRYPVGGWSAR